MQYKKLEQIDQETGSEYLKILKIHLEENGNIPEVAETCFLHRNTVTYHLKKIREITGKNLGETRNRTLWVRAYLIRNRRNLLEYREAAGLWIGMKSTVCELCITVNVNGAQKPCAR